MAAHLGVPDAMGIYDKRNYCGPYFVFSKFIWVLLMELKNNWAFLQSLEGIY